MNQVRFLILGVMFGIIMSKAEIVSWYRIQEMFRFDSFHMYGVIGSAVVLGAIVVQVIRRSEAKNRFGERIQFIPKQKTILRYLIGGTLFGLGWALVGACPGPMFVLLGHGYGSLLWVILGALLGTFSYGIARSSLPH